MSAEREHFRRSLAVFAVFAVLAGAAAPRADALGGRGSTAALQVALRATGFYLGDIDGLRGPATAQAVRRFQRSRGLVADGIVGPRTRRALGRRGRPLFGVRSIGSGMRGWDVAALQFLLARAGFPNGTIDGGFGARTGRAVRRFQQRAGLTADGLAGPATLAALRRPAPRSPIRLARPVGAPIGDAYGFRGTRLHAGLDFEAGAGVPVSAAAPGTVVTTGYDPGWGRYVLVAHGGGVRTLYGHLSAITVSPGRPVATGTRIGLVGSTGTSTGPHLHFEVFVRGANVDPLTALG